MKRFFYLSILTIAIFTTMISIIACGSDTDEKTTSPSPGITSSQPVNTSEGATSKPSNPYEVLLTDQGFEPIILHVPVGTTVTWHNIDRTRNQRHWVKSKDGLFDTRVIPVEARATVTFNEKGEFEYYCVYHRDREEEQGKIIVE